MVGLDYYGSTWWSRHICGGLLLLFKFRFSGTFSHSSSTVFLLLDFCFYFFGLIKILYSKADKPFP